MCSASLAFGNVKMFDEPQTHNKFKKKKVAPLSYVMSSRKKEQLSYLMSQQRTLTVC